MWSAPAASESAPSTVAAIEPPIGTAAMTSPTMLDASDSVLATCIADLHVDDPDAPSQLDSHSMPTLVISPSAPPTSADANTSLDLAAPNASNPGAPGQQSDAANEDDDDSRRVERDDDIIAARSYFKADGLGGTRL